MCIRDSSCDEQVLKVGIDRQIYASAILRVCEFYLAAPLAMVSRVTGSNLKTRIEDIMTPRMILRVGSGRMVLLAFAAVALVVTPVLFGVTTAPTGLKQLPVTRTVPTQAVPAAPRPVERAAAPVVRPQVRQQATVQNTPPPDPGPRGDYQI